MMIVEEALEAFPKELAELCKSMGCMSRWLAYRM